MWQQNDREREREEKERTELRGSPLIKATSMGGKTESYLLLMQFTSGSLFQRNTGHPCLI